MRFIGRENELLAVRDFLRSEGRGLAAVLGMRGVGKTYFLKMIAEQEKENFKICYLTGKRGLANEEHINYWKWQIERKFDCVGKLSTGKWFKFFGSLADELERRSSLNNSEKFLLLIDEFSWFQSEGQDFIEEFGAFWNLIIGLRNIKVIVAGSAKLDGKKCDQCKGRFISSCKFKDKVRAVLSFRSNCLFG